jgi:hypothetical protein
VAAGSDPAVNPPSPTGRTEPVNTLGSLLAAMDERAFVGRVEELAACVRVFSGETTGRVVFVHGPGGVGKSALLRETVRRGRELGFGLVTIEGRDVAPTAEALQAALAPALKIERPLVLIDSYELLAPLDEHLRRSLLPELPEAGVLLIGSRLPPEPGWSRDGWEHMLVHVRLQGLSQPDALDLLTRRGVERKLANTITEWAGGSPLALMLAADTPAGAAALSRGSPGSELQPGRDLVRHLVDRLVQTQPDPRRQRALQVAALARVTTPALLGEVLADPDPLELYAWLATQTITEPVGEGLALHDLARGALRADLRSRDSAGERDLRRRIIDHLYVRAVSEHLGLTIDLSELTENPIVRVGYGWESGMNVHLDPVRPGDADAIEREMVSREHGEFVRGTLRFIHEAPERMGVARNDEGELIGYFVSVTPANAPDFADEDPMLGPWLAHARRMGDGDDAVLVRDAVDFTQEVGAQIDPSPVQGLINMASVIRAGVHNPRYCYIPVHLLHVAAAKLTAALGAKHELELDVEVGGQGFECHILDYGPGRLLGYQRDFLYRELGLEPPGERGQPVDPVETVREALRAWHRPDRLATSPLARGDSVAERAESVRLRLTDAIEQVFGDSTDERLSREVLTASYLSADVTHEQAADDLYLSRAVYFRRLRAAVTRVASVVSER